MPSAYRPICDAVAQNDLGLLRQEIERNPNGATGHWKPLVDAAFLGRRECVQILQEFGTDSNIRGGGRTSHTALTRICQPHKTISRNSDHAEIIKMLLDAGADPLIAGGHDELFPLFAAYMGSNPDLIEALEQPTLTEFIKREEHQELFVYAVQYALPELQKYPGSTISSLRDQSGRNVMHYVALSSRYQTREKDASVQCARFLCEEVGMDPGEAQLIPEGDEVFMATPLWWTLSRQQNYALARYFLDLGVDPTPCVFMVSFSGDQEAIELLDAYSPDWNHRFEGKTSLMELVIYNRTRLIPWLIEHGADVSLGDNNGRTLLHHAVLRGIKTDWIELFIKHGCDPDKTDDAGQTALDLAYQKNRKKAIEFLTLRS